MLNKKSVHPMLYRLYEKNIMPLAFIALFESLVILLYNWWFKFRNVIHVPMTKFIMFKRSGYSFQKSQIKC